MKKETTRIDAVNGCFEISLKINGVRKNLKVKNTEFLLDALRRHGYKGAKKGCDTGDCGSCAVMFDGRPALACLIPAFSSHGAEVTTIEGVGTVRAPHPVQEAFVEAGAVQCGYCIPGMIISAKHLLDTKPEPTEGEIRKYLDGNLCRCTGYVKQIAAVKAAAKKMAKFCNRIAVSTGLVMMLVAGGQTAINLTKDKALDDVVYLFKMLEETHPDLFFRFPKKDYAREKDTLMSKYRNLENDALTSEQLNRDISFFLNKIHDGHTNSLLPATSGQLRMPFRTELVENRLFIETILKDSMGVLKGDEIIAVNNMPVSDYLHNLISYKSFEVYERAALNVAWSFPYKSSHFDSNELNLKIRKNGDAEYAVKSKWEEINTKDSNDKLFEFNYLDDVGAGYILWNAFFDRRVHRIYRERGMLGDTKVDEAQWPDYEFFLHDVFKTLSEKKAGYLIVDLRNNGGGHGGLGNNFISFLTDKEIKNYDGYIKLSPLLKKTYGDKLGRIFDKYPMGARVTDDQSEEILGKKTVFSELELRKKPGNKFAGKVILLTGYGTYSSAESFVVLMKDNALGIVIGEPTGNGGNGPIDTLNFDLPNSKVKIQCSFAFRIRPDTDKRNEKIVEPDIRVSQTALDYLNGKDTVLESVKQMILAKKI